MYLSKLEDFTTTLPVLHLNNFVACVAGAKGEGKGEGEKCESSLSPIPPLFPFLPIPYAFSTPAMQANNFGDFLLLQMGVINKLCIKKDWKDT